MRRRSLTLATLTLAAAPAGAGIVVNTDPFFAYTQTFDALTNTTGTTPWANDSTLAGWSLFTAAGTPITSYSADTGSSTAGGFKSFGAALDSDRALGGLGSGGAYFGSPANGAIAGWIAVAFTNATGSALAGFALGFDGEQWRNGGNATAQTMVLEYGFGPSFGAVSAWTAPGGNFDWTSPIASATTAAVNGNSAGRVAGRGGSVTADWAADSTLWVRWVERNDLGNDHSLAIDNLTFSAVPEPGSLVLLVVGAVPFGFARRRAMRRI